jgi:predicted PurR-regulated permease PerM
MTTEAPDSRAWRPDGERIASFVVMVTVLYFAYVTLRPVLVVVVLAAALASLTAGSFAWTVRRLRGRRRLAAMLMVLLLLGGVLGSFTVFAVSLLRRLVGQATSLAQRQDLAASLDGLSAHLGPLGPPLRQLVEQLRPQLAERVPSLFQHGAHLLQSLGQAVTQLAIRLFLLAVTLYYFYLSGASWRDRLIQLLPLPADDVRMFFARFHQVSVAVLVGNLGTALAQGGVATLGFWLLGVPAPLVFGLLTVCSALIPLIGSWLVWAPLAVWLGVTQSWARGLALAAYGLCFVSVIDNVLRPVLTRRGLRENPLLIFLAVFGGLESFGIVGLFVGPLVMALTITVVDLYAKKRATSTSPTS